MQEHANTIDMTIGIQMIDARCVEGAGPANDAVHFVAFLQKEIGQITAVLSGDSGDQRFFHRTVLALTHRVPRANAGRTSLILNFHLLLLYGPPFS